MAFLLSKYADIRFETAKWFLVSGLVWSYLPLFQYDATLFRGVNNQKSEEKIMMFDLRLVLSFRTMGVFFPTISISCTGVYSELIGPSVGVVHNAQISSSPKPLCQSKPNFMWSLLG